MRRYTLLALTLCVACGTSGSGGSDRIYANPAQGYSIAKPNGWEASRLRDVVELTPTDNSAKRKHTIVIRSTAKPRELREGKPATKEAIVATTERVLRGLPRAKLEAKATSIDNSELPAMRMSISFVPQGFTRSYRREHAVLIGAKHIYHVFYTSPASEPVDEASFARVVTTLTEEG
jgi:hypothetical protein